MSDAKQIPIPASLLALKQCLDDEMLKPASIPSSFIDILNSVDLRRQLEHYRAHSRHNVSSEHVALGHLYQARVVHANADLRRGIHLIIRAMQS